MSIGIAIAVPDGIALAADTQTTWTRTINSARIKPSNQKQELSEPIKVPVGWSKRARKLFNVIMGDKNYAVITAGMAHLNSKSMYAVFKSAAQNYNGDGSINHVNDYLVNQLKTELAAQLSCSIDELSNQTINTCEYVLATYENDDVAKPVVENHLVYSGEITINGNTESNGHYQKWSNRATESRYGGCWIGRSEFITHILKHSNKQLPQITGQYGMMTLADAVDYTKFLIEYVCDYQRFAIMVPDCGRPITSSTLTPEKYTEKIVGQTV